MAKRTNGVTAPEPREGMPDPKLGEAEFRPRFGARFADPAFTVETDAIDRLATIAWQAYRDGRRAPVATLAAGRTGDRFRRGHARTGRRPRNRKSVPKRL